MNILTISTSLLHLKNLRMKQRKRNDGTLSRPNWQKHKHCICLIKKVTGTQIVQQEERTEVWSRATAHCLSVSQTILSFYAVLPSFFGLTLILLKYASYSLYNRSNQI